MNPKAFLTFLSFLVIGFQSCQDERTFSELTAVTKGDILASWQGGEYSFEYSLQNPPDGGTLDVSLPDSVTWITGVDFGTDGIVTFDVAANYAKSQRYAVMTISYSTMALSFRVVQDAYGMSSSESPFVITVKEVTASSAKAEIDPLDDRMTYVALNSPRSYVDGFNNDDDLFAAVIEHYVSQGASVGMTLEELLESSGSLVSGNTVKEMMYLPSDMEQYVYAVGCSKSGQRLSPIVRELFKTSSVDKVDRGFRLWYDITGPDVTMWAEPDPVGDDRWYFFDLFSVAEYEESGLTPEQILQSFIDQNIQLGLAVGLSPEAILPELLSVGRDSYFYNLEAETDYIGAACGVDMDGKINSEPVLESFRTGEVRPSDNILEVEIMQINLDWVEVGITTTNNDPYVVIVTPASEYEGMNEEQIMERLLRGDLAALSLNGDYKGRINGLSYETEYLLYAFGYRSGKATTEPVRKYFKTLGEEDPSLLTFDFAIDNVTDWSVDVIVSGNPASALYYWGVCPASWTEDDIMESLEKKLEDNRPWVVDMADLFRQYGSRGTVDYGKYIPLESDTDYVVYAFGVYEDTGEWATEVSYSGIFHTLK